MIKEETLDLLYKAGYQNYPCDCDEPTTDLHYLCFDIDGMGGVWNKNQWKDHPEKFAFTTFSKKIDPTLGIAPLSSLRNSKYCCGISITDQKIDYIDMKDGKGNILLELKARAELNRIFGDVYN